MWYNSLIGMDLEWHPQVSNIGCLKREPIKHLYLTSPSSNLYRPCTIWLCVCGGEAILEVCWIACKDFFLLHPSTCKAICFRSQESNSTDIRASRKKIKLMNLNNFSSSKNNEALMPDILGPTKGKRFVLSHWNARNPPLSRSIRLPLPAMQCHETSDFKSISMHECMHAYPAPLTRVFVRMERWHSVKRVKHFFKRLS